MFRTTNNKVFFPRCPLGEPPPLMWTEKRSSRTTMMMMLKVCLCSRRDPDAWKHQINVSSSSSSSSQWTEIDRFLRQSSTRNTKWGKWSETGTLLWWRSVWRGGLHSNESLIFKLIYFLSFWLLFVCLRCQGDGAGVRPEDHR